MQLKIFEFFFTAQLNRILQSPLDYCLLYSRLVVDVEWGVLDRAFQGSYMQVVGLQDRLEQDWVVIDDLDLSG